MRIDNHVNEVHEQLIAAAALGDERTREIAGVLTTAAVPAVRLALFAAVSAVADEITAALLDQPGSPQVGVRLNGDEVAVTVRAISVPPEPTPDLGADGLANARISLRLPDSLKAEIDAAAEAEGVSVNTWLVRSAALALRRGGPDPVTPGRGRGRGNDSHHITGWINS